MYDLNESLQRLASFLHEWTGGAATWSDIAIVEESAVAQAGKGLVISRASLTTPDEYAGRFDDLMSRGYSWLNMNAAGVVEGTLVVLVELPSYVTGVKGHTSVNLSGPPIREGRSQWDASRYITFTEQA